MYDGYIKLWRKTIESEVFADPILFKLWCLCLMKANHKTNYVPIEGISRPIKVEPGQFITGRYSLHKEFYYRPSGGRHAKKEVSPQTLQRKLRLLENMQNLNINSYSKYSMITICNWSEYQSSEQQLNNSRTTAEQQLNTNKNDKNVKNEKNNYLVESDEFLLSNQLLNLILTKNPNHKKPNLQKWSKHISDMIRIDKRDIQDISDVINWCQADEFWSPNILSTKKLRDKFDQLYLKMKKTDSGYSKTTEKNIASAGRFLNGK